jgi:hypothetical protein
MLYVSVSVARLRVCARRRYGRANVSIFTLACVPVSVVPWLMLSDIFQPGAILTITCVVTLPALVRRDPSRLRPRRLGQARPTLYCSVRQTHLGVLVRQKHRPRNTEHAACFQRTKTTTLCFESINHRLHHAGWQRGGRARDGRLSGHGVGRGEFVAKFTKFVSLAACRFPGMVPSGVSPDFPARGSTNKCITPNSTLDPHCMTSLLRINKSARCELHHALFGGLTNQQDCH